MYRKVKERCTNRHDVDRALVEQGLGKGVVANRLLGTFLAGSTGLAAVLRLIFDLLPHYIGK